MISVRERWQVSSVGEVAEVISGPAFKSRDFGGPGDGVRLLRGDNIEPGRLRWDRTRTLPVSMLRGCEHLLIRENDLILAMDRPVISTGLKLATATALDVDSLLVQRVARIRAQSVESRFLGLALQEESFKRYLQQSYTGTQLPHVTLKAIKSYRIPLPPLEEQRRIVEILEDHLSRLDAANAYLSSGIARARSFEDRSILFRLLPCSRGTAVAEIAAGAEPALPTGWLWKPLGEVARVAGGVTKDSKKQADPTYVEVPYLRVANVQRARLDLGNVTTIRVRPAQAEALRLLPGDVLMNEGGDRDKLARGWVWSGEIPDCIHQNHVFRARPVVEQVRPEWLAWCANTYGTRWAQRHGRQSVNLASISLSTLKMMPVPVAPLDVQDAALAEIRALIGVLRSLERDLNSANSRSGALRRSLLAAAFSGRLTGRSSDLDRVEEMALT